MAHCEFAHLCDYSFLDSSGKLCIIGIFDRIFAKHVPANHHQAYIALGIRGEPGEKVDVRVEAVRPTGGVLAKVGGDVTLGTLGGGQVQMKLAGLPLPDWGTYSFNIYFGDDRVTTIPVTVATQPVNAPS